MQAIVIYQTKYGITEKIAANIASSFTQKPLLINLKKELTPELSDYDTIILGGSIHFGKIPKEMQSFCKKHLNFLLTKNIGLFISCICKGKNASLQFTNAFPSQLITHAKAKGILGGELDFSKISWTERMLVRKTMGIKESQYKIDTSAINSFVAQLRA